MRDSLLLTVFGLILGFAVFCYGGVTSSEWSYCVAALAIASMVLWVAAPAAILAPAPDPKLLVALAGLLVAIGLQLVPLPLSWLETLAPARAAIASAAIPVGGARTAALSVSPVLTLLHLIRVLAYIVVFFAIREIAWRSGRRRWIAVVPVICIACLESAVGLAQYFGGGGAAKGTYVNPNHFAGMLGMALPLAVMMTVNRIRRRHATDADSIAQASVICLLLLCCAAIVTALMYSLSRSGMIAALLSAAVLTVFAALRAKTRRSRMMSAALLPAAIVLAVFLLTPGALLQHFSATPAVGEVTAEARVQFWRETLLLIRNYPLFGCGLGTYASAIQKYRTSSPLLLLDYAHNDYLQLAAELGVAGMVPLAIAVWLVFRNLLMTALREDTRSTRYLALGCLASLTALGVHSVTDFNLYIPANAMLAAWIAGLGSSLNIFSGRKSAGLASRTAYIAEK